MLHILTEFLAASSLLPALTLPLGDIYVDLNAANCATGTGTAANPVCSIAEGITLASPGDTIRVAPGRYFEHLYMWFDLEIIGTEGEAVTIIDGGAQGKVVQVGAPATVVLDGLTITNGARYPSSPFDTFGSGISIYGAADFTLKNSTVSGNTAIDYRAVGAGIGAVNYGAMTSGSSITIIGSTIHSNRTDAYSYYSSGEGAGVYVRGGYLTIVDSTIRNNIAYAGYGGAGGGVFANRSEVSITNSTISANSADGGYGFYGSAFGGVGARRSMIVITNSTISENTATYGSGFGVLSAYPGSLLANITVTANLGLNAAITDPYAGIDIRDSIIAGNFNGPNNTGLRGRFNSLGHNLIGTGGPIWSYGGAPAFIHGVNNDQVGMAAYPIDPRLDALRDNGGPTRTHALLPGSPAIDSGSNPPHSILDQRRAVRLAGLAPDIGAFELGGSLSGICHGDGGNQVGCTHCPCGNDTPPGTPGGCINSSGQGARIQSSGDTSVSLPTGHSVDLRFGLTGAPPNTFCILNSGNSIGPENATNPCFGLYSGSQSNSYDGLRCAIINTRRHGGRLADMNGIVGATNSPWGGGGAPTNGLSNGFGAGQTRFFQVIFRETLPAVCQRGLNTSQAIGVTFSR